MGEIPIPLVRYRERMGRGCALSAVSNFAFFGIRGIYGCVCVAVQGGAGRAAEVLGHGGGR